VTEYQLRRAQRLTPIASIQNRYNIDDRRSEGLIDLCEQEQIAFLPWGPITDVRGNWAVQQIAAARRYTARSSSRRSPLCVLWNPAASVQAEEFVLTTLI
jgi:pyridoxine 4-dehydrogenase